MWIWIGILAIVAADLGLTALILRSRRRIFRDLVATRKQADERGSLLALEHETTYRLACQLYGRSSVDRSIRQAHERGERN